MSETLLTLLTVVIASVAAGLGAVCRLLLDGFVTASLARSAASDSQSPPTGSWRMPGHPGLWARFGSSVRALPWGTLAVNLSGSLIIGVVAGVLTLDSAHGSSALAHDALVAGIWRSIAMLGFLSGYTTFSTASYQTVRLAQSGRWAAAAVNGIAQLVVATVAVGLGWAAVWGIVALF